jgi:hypothetical protein
MEVLVVAWIVGVSFCEKLAAVFNGNNVSEYVSGNRVLLTGFQ